MEKKKIQSFKDLVVWQKAKEFAVFIYKVTHNFPREELYGLTSQIRRAVISISSNIAEGFKKEFKKRENSILSSCSCLFSRGRKPNRYFQKFRFYEP